MLCCKRQRRTWTKRGVRDSLVSLLLVAETPTAESRLRADQHYRVTQEGVRMATAEVLNVAHNVEHGVESIGGQVRGIGGQVKGVTSQVMSVGSQVTVITEQVKDVDNKVKDVYNKVNMIVEGTFNTLTQMSS